MSNSKQQRFASLLTQRRVFNYGNDDKVSAYHSFFSGSTAGGNIVPENTLVLSNDNSSLDFSADFSAGFDTLYDWNCVFNTAGTNAYVAASRNASAIDGNNLIGPAQPQFSRLPIQIDSASPDGHIYANESRNYLKMKPGGRTFVEIQGIFNHTGTTTNTFSELIGYARSGDFLDTEQIDWNVDTFIKGSPRNPSGIEIDFKKIQTLVLMFYDKEVGDMRFGFLIENTIHYAHIMAINNNPDEAPSNPDQFFSAGNLNLPIRDEVEIKNGIVTRKVGVFNNENGFFFLSRMDITNEPALVQTQYLQSVVAYNIGGGDKDYRIPFVAGTKEVLKTVSAPSIPLFSVKAADLLSGITNRTVFNFDKINIHATGSNLNEGCYFEVIYNGTLANETFAETPNNESGLEYDITADSITGGIVLYSGEVYATESKLIDKSDLRKEYIDDFSRKSITLAPGATPATVTKDDILTVVATPLSNTSTINVGASMQGGEIS